MTTKTTKKTADGYLSTTYSERNKAVRGAKRALGADTTEGVQFIIEGPDANGRFSWKPLARNSASPAASAAPAPKATPKAAEPKAEKPAAKAGGDRASRQAALLASAKQGVQSKRQAAKAKSSEPKAGRGKHSDVIEKLARREKGLTREDLKNAGVPNPTPRQTVKALARRLKLKFWQKEVEGTSHYGVA